MQELENIISESLARKKLNISVRKMTDIVNRYCMHKPGCIRKVFYAQLDDNSIPVLSITCHFKILDKNYIEIYLKNKIRMELKIESLPLKIILKRPKALVS